MAFTEQNKGAVYFIFHLQTKTSV